MIPLILFLLACAAVFFGTVQTAFSTLMRLSLRLLVERNGSADHLGRYLEDPLSLFVSVRIWLALDLILVTVLAGSELRPAAAYTRVLFVLGIAAYVLLCEHVVPTLIVRRNPEAVLDALLPVFEAFARPVRPVAAALGRALAPARRERPAPAPATPDATGEAVEAAVPYEESDDHDRMMEGEERKLLQSIVDFGDTLVREVMTPRPDIVSIRSDATTEELRALVREQEYSRVPVFKDSLDNIVGFVFVKDLITLAEDTGRQPIAAIMRPAYFVPETKRVSELLKEFQRNHTQVAIVLDEYGGTAGLVTLEDLLEEIVGEIRDEYDVETEPITDEGNGAFLFSGKVNIDEVAERLETPIEREGFETVGGYLLSHLGRVPTVGESFDIDGLSVEVLEAERRRVTKVRIRRREQDAEGREVPSRP